MFAKIGLRRLRRSHMLKGIDQRLSAEIVHVLMLMGHGDDLVICDVNHPAATIAAETTYGRLIDMAGCDIPTAAAAILTLMPLDTFVPAPVSADAGGGRPRRRRSPIFARMQAVVDNAEGRPVTMRGAGTLRLLRRRQAGLRDHPHRRAAPTAASS